MTYRNDPYDPKQVAAVARRRSTTRSRARTRRSPPPPTWTRWPPSGPPTSATARRCCWPAASSARCRRHAQSDAGKRVNAARSAITGPTRPATPQLRADRDERVLAEERVDVTLPWDRRRARRPAPADHADGADRRHLRRHGLRGRRGPRARGGVAQLRRAQHRARPPGALHDGHLLRRAPPRDSGLVLRTHTSRCRRARCCPQPPIYVVCPGRVYRTDELDATHTPVFHQVEGLVVDRGITMAHLRGTLDHFARAHVRAGRAYPLAAVATSRSPSRRRSSTCGSPSTATARAGSSGAAAAWSTRGCWWPAASTRTSTPGSPSAWASSGRCSSATASADMRDIVEGDVRFTRAFGMEV